MSFHVFNAAALPVTPWKNGGGITREIALGPAGAGLDDFDWRVSIAKIEAGGAFSRFPGVERTIVLLAGGGVRLDSSDDAIHHPLDKALEPFDFSGDLELHATLLAGASIDFNVMTRRARLRSRTQIVRSRHRPQARHGLVYVTQGSWSLPPRSGLSSACTTGSGFWWQDEQPGWEITPDAADCSLILVQFEQVKP